MKKANFFSYLQLMRPANIVTAIADVLAGIVIAGVVLYPFTRQSAHHILLLIISTSCLYGGGIVFNDVFDADLDQVERPERPIPSGELSIREAKILGTVLLFTGTVTAALVSIQSFFIAVGIVIAALVYNRWAKHHSFFGPLNMGLCRALNLLLGISITAISVTALWYLSFIPLIFIAAITLISRGEVHGGGKRSLFVALLLYVITAASVLIYAIHKGYERFIYPFLLLWLLLVIPPLFKAIQLQTGPAIGKAVKNGVLSLIAINAAWAAASGSWQSALIILLLLPVSMLLANIFAVT